MFKLDLEELSLKKVKTFPSSLAKKTTDQMLFSDDGRLLVLGQGKKIVVLDVATMREVGCFGEEKSTY
jgi:hypothetical protein